MIVPMKKVYVAARKSDRDRLLDGARRVGVVHLEPVAPAEAVANAEIIDGIDRLGRAIQVLATVEPGQPASAVDLTTPAQAAREVLRIEQEAAEKRSRLAVLARKIDQLAFWADARLEQFKQMANHGVDLRFYLVGADKVDEFSADLVQVLDQGMGKRVLVAVASRDGEVVVPDSAEQIPLPQADRPTVRAEAERIDHELKAAAARLSELAGLREEMVRLRRELQSKAEYAVASGGGLDAEKLYAIQGWVPADAVETLADDLAKLGVEAVVEALDPTADEQPPTLIRYPACVRPIKALFDMLGTIPGFHEIDLSGFFMIAMPIFVAMLIGDAGYGLLFLIVFLAMARKIATRLGRPAAWLLIIFAATTLAWGIVTADYFGVTPRMVARFAGYTHLVAGQPVGDVKAMLASGHGGWVSFGKVMFNAAPLYRIDDEDARNIIIKISFVLGCLHLVSAQLRQAAGKWPDIRFLANIGWALVLPGMLGVIWQMFFVGIDRPWHPAVFVLIAAGFSLAVLFSYPSGNPAKRLAIGLLANIMPLINSFSDTISYIRLMAVGLASYYIAYSFDMLAGQVADASHWLLAVPVLIFGHGLNIGLGIVAIFAHGVRLNMLEFSSNAGVQWSGRAYRPFAETPALDIKES